MFSACTWTINFPNVQIGCGIELNQVRLIGQAGIGTSGSSITGGVIPTGVTFPISGKIEVHPRPGTVRGGSITTQFHKWKAVSISAMPC